jgi:hypothetical protein
MDEFVEEHSVGRTAMSHGPRTIHAVAMTLVRRDRRGRYYWPHSRLGDAGRMAAEECWRGQAPTDRDMILPACARPWHPDQQLPDWHASALPSDLSGLSREKEDGGPRTDLQVNDG